VTGSFTATATATRVDEPPICHLNNVDIEKKPTAKKPTAKKPTATRVDGRSSHLHVLSFSHLPLISFVSFISFVL